MYTFSSKLKTFSLILMAVGLLGIGYGFLSAPKDIQEVEAILASDAHGSHHEAAAEVTATVEESHVAAEVAPKAEEALVANKVADTATQAHDSIQAPVSLPAVASTEVKVVKEESKEDAAAEHQKHLKHVLTQLQNKPWSALYVVDVDGGQIECLEDER